jgi:hypothetical protein
MGSLNLSGAGPDSASDIRSRAGSPFTEKVVDKKREHIRRTPANGPWLFKDKALERQYESESADKLYDRSKYIGRFYVIIAWLFKVPYYYARFASPYKWTLEEWTTSFLKQCMLMMYTLLIILNFSDERKKSIGIFLLWHSRILNLPLQMIQEMGIPQFPTQLATTQVEFILYSVSHLKG